MQSPRVPFGRNAFRNVGYRTVDAGLLKSSLIQETMRLQFPAEAFNLFNFRNVAFVSAYDYLNNPAFIYGWGILRNFQIAAPDSGYMRQRTASSGYDFLNAVVRHAASGPTGCDCCFEEAPEVWRMERNDWRQVILSAEPVASTG